jgi:integrase
MKQLLSDSIDDYLAHRAARRKGNSPARLKSIKITLRRLLTVVGNIYTENIHEGHIDAYFLDAARTRPRSLTLDASNLRGFFKWAIRTKRAGKNGDPMADHEVPAPQPRPWRGFGVGKLPAFLDAATHPRDRILLALAAYVLGRSIEFTILRIGDVDLDAGYISYTITKTGKVDLIPITTELDEELRQWLTAYAEECGPLDPTWYLVPAKTAPNLIGSRTADRSSARLKPTVQMKKPHGVAQAALKAIGYSIVDERGKTRYEGMHTVRRSIARALHDQLREEGDPNPVETVRSMLNHGTERETRRYIGLETSRQHRDARLRGKPMFPGLRGGNVSELDTYRRDKEAAGADG